VNSTIRTDEIAQTGPATFVGVDVNFTDAISIVIPSIFVLAVTNGVACALQAIVAVVFIGVECCIGLRKTLDKRTERFAFCVLHHANAYLL